MPWMRGLVCRLVGHAWLLRSNIRMRQLEPAPPETVAYFHRKFGPTSVAEQGVWVEQRDAVWVCTRCGASVPLGQSEGALRG